MVLFVALVSAGSASANFAPIAQVAATVPDGLEGQPVVFTSQGSMDPDQSPAPLTFAWDFGDGAQGTGPSPSHTYAQAGSYRVTLTVSDGADSVIAAMRMVVLAPVSGISTRASSPLALSADGRWLWAANPDSDSVTLVDTQALTKAAEIAVGRHPRTLALSEDGSRLWVACEDSDGLWEVDPLRRRVVGPRPAGKRPYAVVVLPGSGRLLVTSQATDTVEVLDSNGAPVVSIAVADHPRAVAVSATRQLAYVTHYLTRGAAARVSRIALGSLALEGESALAEDVGPDTSSSGRGFPNLLSAVVIEPSERMLWVGGVKSNTSVGAFVSGAAARTVNVVRGLVAPISLADNVERPARRIDTDNADGASAMAFSPSGRFLYVTHQGLGALSAYDVGGLVGFNIVDGSSVPFDARVAVGDAPQGVALSPAGDRAYVLNFLSRNLSVLDLSTPAHPAPVAEVSLTDEPLAPSVALGKKLFYRSANPRHSFEGYIACTSCHPDGGGSDGRTWDFTARGEGLRNTKDLRGVAGLGHGPLHWSANFDEVQDFELDIVKHSGGAGLLAAGEAPYPALGEPNQGRSEDLDALADYVTSLSVPPRSPYRTEIGSLSEAAMRGKVVFNDAGCPACHPAPSYTDSSLETFVLHDVGTLGPSSGHRLDGPLTGIDTPSLLGVWDSAPYFHDGSAATLDDVFSPQRAGPHALSLETAALDVLKEFLNALDGRPDVVVPTGHTFGCACGHGPGSASAATLWVIAVSLWIGWRRRA